MRTFALSIMLVCAAAAVAPAQDYQDGWYLGVWNSPADLIHVDNAGAITTILTSTALPLGGNPHSVAIDVDNDTLIVAYWDRFNLTGGVVHVDANGVLLNHWRPTGGGQVNDVVLDQDGNFIVAVGGGPNGPALLRVDRMGRESTFATGGAMLDPIALTRDIATGDYFVVERFAPSADLTRVPRTGGGSTVFAGLPNSPGPQITQDRTNGDLYVVGSLSRAVFKVSRGAAVSFFLTHFSLSVRASVHLGRASAATPVAAVVYTPVSYALTRVDLATAIPTGVRTLPGYQVTHVVPARSRNTATLARGPRQWDIRVNNPIDGGFGYVVALSLTPPYPGTSLPDGRRLAFRPDALTTVALSGGLGPVLQNFTGQLTPAGLGVASLDLRSVPQLQGVRVWIQAVVLDPAAPLGLRTIFDPILFVT